MERTLLGKARKKEHRIMKKMLLVSVLSVVVMLIFVPPAEAMWVCGANAKSYRNTGPQGANDFHVEWCLPTLASAQDVSNNLWYYKPFVVGEEFVWNQTLSSNLPKNGYLTLFYCPGGGPEIPGIDIFDNLLYFNFTPSSGTGAKSVDIFSLFEFLFHSAPTASLTFYNQEASEVKLTNVKAWKDIDIQYLTVGNGEFAKHTGTSVSIDSSFTIGAGSSKSFDFGNVNQYKYELVTGKVALTSDPTNTYYFAFAAPEPATLTLLGLGELALVRRRRGRVEVKR